MSYADKVFVQRCKEILLNGISDGPLEVRTKWPSDGVPAHTKKILYVQDRYDLSDGSIPVITLRRQGFKNCVDEILWIYQKKSNRLEDLNSHVWDSWDIGDGTIGKAYGYQIGLPFRHHRYTSEEEFSKYPSAMAMRSLVPSTYDIEHGAGVKFENTGDKWVWMDQMDAVLYDLTNNPGSRRIMTNTYNHSDLADMGLAPCAYQMVFNVTVDKDGNKILNGCLNQRSQDMLTANGWNVMQYSILLHMVAIHCGMKPGIFVHNIFDCHIYDRHERIVSKLIDLYLAAGHPSLGLTGDGWEDLLAKDENGRILLDRYIDEIPCDKPYPNPKLWINPEKKNFYDFTVDDFKLIDYQYCYFNHKIGNGLDCDIEVAI